ncbi:DUF2334 domain-containing protein [Lacrimispora sp. AGF001]|uniref:DUF2334 domain-containing protein n=1 Tax=Lacrimispora sp. AGF001 TaxID=3401631 RepID=UPI003B42FD77
MNCSMMYKKFLFYIAGFLFISLASLGRTVYSFAEEVPKGDILIIYQDNADDSTKAAMEDLVKLLTFQSFKISYGPASWGMEYLDGFSYVICYDLKQSPPEFTSRLSRYETKTVINGKMGSPHILFIGNQYFKTYLDTTNRSDQYELLNSTVGQLQYSFYGSESKSGLVREDYFVFFKKSSYQNGIVTVNNKNGYFCAKDGRLTHIPVADMSSQLVRAAMTREVSKWKWPYNGNPHIFAQYILIDKVYPYEDPEKLLQVVKLMIEKKIPFVISVMPMYVNGDYPSMTHFCEVLRFAQAGGGAVIINAPIDQMNPLDKEVMLDYLARAMTIYNKQGVYPLALEVPQNWMFHKDTIEIMSHFKTIFSSDEVDSYLSQEDMNHNEVYKDGHQWVGASIPVDDTKVSYLSVYSTAVPIDLVEDFEEIKRKVGVCQNSFVPLKSLWDVEHSYWLDKQLMTYKNGDLILNGKKMDLSFTPTVYPEQYNYRRNMIQRFSRDLTTQSRRLVIAVGLTSILFVFLILWARLKNRKNYFFHD